MGFLCLLMPVLLSAPVAMGQDLAPSPATQPYDAPGSCMSESQFYQTLDLMCSSCPANRTTAEDGISCRCRQGFYRPAGSGTSNFVCQPCAAPNTVLSADGLFCLECSGGTSFNSATGQCTPCPSAIMRFSDVLPGNQSEVGTRSCEPCPQGTWRDASGFSCVECGIPDCSQCGTVSGGVCLSGTPPAPPPDVFDYYEQHFQAAVEQCQMFSNSTACQLVANLCVLRTYLREDPACEQSVQLASSLPSPLLPPLYYPERQAQEVLSDTPFHTVLLTRPDGSEGVATLPLVLASYSLNGTFLGLDEGVDQLSQQLLLCEEGPSHAQAAWRVGVQYRASCTLTSAELNGRGQSPVFYDLFLRDVDPETGTSQLVPVPVLVTNYRSPQGVLLNEGDTVGRWQLVRRFFIAEAVTDAPQYAHRIELVIELISTSSMNLPYLKVTYEPWIPATPTLDTLEAHYSTVYQQSAEGLILGLSLTVGILFLVPLVYAMIQVNGFLRRSGGLFCEPHTIVYLVVEACAGLSTVIFVVLTLASTFYLIFYKGQRAFIFTVPIESQELVFEILLGVALVCRVLYFAYVMWHQCTVDIFFMDWERPKGVLLTPKTPTNTTDTTNTADLKDGVVTSVPKPVPVSIWRTYFVANEWNEIQSLRKINHTLLLVLVLLFIQVVGLGQLSELDPVARIRVSAGSYSAPYSDVIRFSLTSLHFIIIAFILRVYVFLVHERFIEHKLTQFIDLCSVSNISMIVMPHKLFGHYIHGRSVHGHADTSLREMNKNLCKEQEGMCGHRGLEVESDLQTFQIALTTSFRTQFDKVLAPLREERARGGGGGGGGAITTAATAGGGARNPQQQGDGSGLSETVMKVYESMNLLLTSFCDRSIHGLDYSIKDKLLAEKVLGIEFHDTEAHSLFYRDPSYGFDSILFYGHFWNLLLLDLLVFAVVDLISQNFALAAIITFILAKIVDVVRDGLGRRNLAKKTLVDPRFLI